MALATPLQTMALATPLQIMALATPLQTMALATPLQIMALTTLWKVVAIKPVTPPANAFVNAKKRKRAAATALNKGAAIHVAINHL